MFNISISLDGMAEDDKLAYFLSSKLFKSLILFAIGGLGFKFGNLTLIYRFTKFVKVSTCQRFWFHGIILQLSNKNEVRCIDCTLRQLTFKENIFRISHISKSLKNICPYIKFFLLIFHSFSKTYP